MKHKISKKIKRADLATGAFIGLFLMPFRAEIEEVQNDVSELETRLEKVRCRHGCRTCGFTYVGQEVARGALPLHVLLKQSQPVPGSSM